MNIRAIIRSILQEDTKIKKSFQDTMADYYEHSTELPTIDDASELLKWFYQQITEMIDELKRNHIKTDDYLNTNNWGFKPNDNLAMFDLGFGNYFDDFKDQPEDILNEDVSGALPKILKNLGFESSTYLGGGMFGYAHDVGDNKVLKLTKDKSEAINSKSIIGKKNNHIADIYAVYKFTLNEQQFYAIILEKLIIGNTNRVFELFENYFDRKRNRHINKSVIQKIKDPVVKEFLSDMIKDGYEATWDKWALKLRDSGYYEKFDFNDISGISEWVQESVRNNNYINVSPPSHVIEDLEKLF